MDLEHTTDNEFGVSAFGEAVGVRLKLCRCRNVDIVRK